jgi:hypothetical protein
MTTQQIDVLNIGLMALATVLAFTLPFELFLFSYAVLGPLHYLTEIGWLHKRDYFSTSKYDYLWFLAAGIMLFAFNFIFTGNEKTMNVLLFVTFAAGLAFVLFKNVLYKILFLFVALVAAKAMEESKGFMFLVGIFLPTLIHVFVFTGLFILYGALKSKSITGLFSVVFFILCAVSFFVYVPQFSWYQVSDYAKNSLVESGFAFVNQAFIFFFDMGDATLDGVFKSSIGLGVMRFIAFAYTYHYLNWFSKTSIIKWHDVPKKWLLTVAVVWLASVGIYAYDYRTGLIALYLLSMMHVLLEFPLNYRSFIGIGQELTGFLKTRPAISKK